jgi:hypothetical protein
MTAGLQVAAFVPIPLVNKLMNRAEGWPDYAAHIAKNRAQYHASLLMGDHYSTASLAEFYLPDHPTVFQPTGWHPQFKLWGDYQLTPDTRALFVTSITNVALLNQHPFPSEFGPAKLVDDFWSKENGRNIREFRVYLLEARGKNPPGNRLTASIR